MTTRISPSSFFCKYPSFEPDATASLVAEFNRLAISQKWKKGSKAYEKYKRQCVVEEFAAQGSAVDMKSQSKLQAWQALYTELCSPSGSPTASEAKKLSVPTSIKKCKKVVIL